MINHYQKFRHNNIPEKRVNLETIILDCKPCQRQTVHIYLGLKFKKTSYVYKCVDCGNRYTSLKKLK